MTELIQIGNSKGVRIPKALIEQAGLEDTELELRVTKQGLLIKPVKQPRQGWKEAIEKAQQNGEIYVDHEWLDAPLDTALDDLMDDN